MKYWIPIGVFLCQAALNPAPATERDVTAEHEWLHVVGAARPTQLESADLEIDEATLERFRKAEHPFVDLLERHSIKLGRDGTITRRKLVARHFLTAEGVRSHGNLQQSARASIDELYLEHATLKMPDGATRPMDLRRVRVTAVDEENVFSDIYNVVVPFEGLVPGATAILETKVERPAGRWPLPWELVFGPQGLAPMQRLEVEVTWDEGVTPPKWFTDADFVNCKSQARRLRCSAQDVPALVLDLEAESFYDQFPHLIVSEGRSWNELARAEAGLVAQSVQSAGRLKPLVDRLLDGASTDEEKLRRLHRFVADEIRYVSLSHGASAVAPAPVSRTLDRKYGDCKDKVATFIALAREAGLDAQPVLVGTMRSNVDRLIAPALLYFDHMIACVDGAAPDDRTCIDLTAPSMQTGDLPPDLYGTVALDLSDATAAPRSVRPPPYVWEIEVESTNRLECDGILTETLRRSFRGPGGGQLRSAFTGVTPEERERWVVEDYQEVMGDSNEPQASMGGLNDPAEAFAMETTTEFEIGPLEELEDYIELDSWLLHYAAWFETGNESRPYELRGARIRTTSDFEICLDRSVRFTGPELDLESPFGALRRTYESRAGGVRVATELTLPSATIAVEDLDRFRRFLTRALDQTSIWFSLEEQRGVVRGSR